MYCVADQIKKGFSTERTKINNTYGNKEGKNTVKCTFQNCSGDTGATSAVLSTGGEK